MTEEARRAEQEIDRRAEWIRKHIDVVYGSPLRNLEHLQPRQNRRDFRGEKLYVKQAEPKRTVTVYAR